MIILKLILNVENFSVEQKYRDTKFYYILGSPVL
jgi:hypothetical protein